MENVTGKMVTWIAVKPTKNRYALRHNTTATDNVARNEMVCAVGLHYSTNLVGLKIGDQIYFPLRLTNYVINIRQRVGQCNVFWLKVLLLFIFVVFKFDEMI